MLTDAESKILFDLIVLFCPILASAGAVLSRRNKDDIIGKLFIGLSFLLAFMPLAFRTNGIDEGVYYLWYRDFESLILSNYQFTPEPAFVLLLAICKYWLHSYQMMKVIAAFVFLWGVYKEMLRSCSDVLIGMLLVFVYLYFYMFGITRMAIAIGIMSYSYKHLRTREWKKYLAFVMLAVLFHYTAIVGLLTMLAYSAKSKTAIRTILVIAAVFLAIDFMLSVGGNNYPALARYSVYVEFNFDINQLKNYIVLIPAVLFFICDAKTMNNLCIDYARMRNIALLIIIIMVFSSCHTGLFRLLFYFVPIVGFYYSAFNESMKARGLFGVTILMALAFIVLGEIYINRYFFDSPYIAQYLIPFEFGWAAY